MCIIGIDAIYSFILRKRCLVGFRSAAQLQCLRLVFAVKLKLCIQIQKTGRYGTSNMAYV